MGWVALPLIAWLSSGLAAVALAPRNVASRALVAAGVLWTASWLLEQPARDATGTAAALLTTTADAAFLAGLVSVVALLATFPQGEFGSPRHRVAVLVLGLVAMVGPLLRLAGDPELGVPGTDRSRVNPVAADGWGWLGDVGDLLVASEPLWILLGVVLLAVRMRSGTPTPAELRPLLVATGVLALLLVASVTAAALGAPLPDGLLRPLFLVALAALPIVLLAGISSRTRALDRELAASRTRLVAAEDRARRRIERDLHDGVQQQLVALLPLLELAGRQCGRDPARASQTLREVRDQVTTAVQDLRELVSGIRPPVLEDAGVAAALESRFAALADQVTLTTDAVRRRWPPETEAAAYFVACEAVTNALKHAPGSPVRVWLDDRDDALVLEVQDDGAGIDGRGSDPGLLRAGGGLSGLRDRVDSLGGAFTVASRPSGGTSVRAEFGRRVAQ